MLRTDRLAQVTETLATIVDTTPLPLDELPPTVAALVKLATRFGMNPETTLRALLASSLRSLPSRASSDPARADRVAAWSADLLAWLRDEREDPPGELVL